MFDALSTLFAFTNVPGFADAAGFTRFIARRKQWAITVRLTSNTALMPIFIGRTAKICYKGRQFVMWLRERWKLVEAMYGNYLPSSSAITATTTNKVTNKQSCTDFIVKMHVGI